MTTYGVDLTDVADSIIGCLLAGAVGDALGAPVEFGSLDDIRRVAGPEGVSGYLPAYGREAGAITDDTQMTLFTAEGLLRAATRWHAKGICHPPSVVHRAYLRWLFTQGEPWPAEIQHAGDPRSDGWLIQQRVLHARRAPGNTCIGALASAAMGTLDAPPNDSKGCGAVMRAAPVGLIDAVDPFRLAVDCAVITHGHPSGYLSAGVLAVVVDNLVRGVDLDIALDRATAELEVWADHSETAAALDAARGLAAGGRPTAEAIETLGGGWTGEEALAIAVCAALASEDIVDGLRLAVSHSGDTDSTGAICGNLLGAALGRSAIPASLLEPLEARDVIEQVGQDLVDAFWGDGLGDGYHRDERFKAWWDRYPGY
jgi:ADP-ribosylglycohydrolase